MTIIQGTLAATVSVPIVDEFLVEPDETLSLEIGAPLSTPAGDFKVGTTTAETTILNDDSATVSIIAAPPGEVDETAGTGKMLFLLTMSSPSSTLTTVDFSDTSTEATLGDDYSGVTPATSEMFAAGETVKFITIDILDDVDLEGAENIELTIDTVTSTGGLAVTKDLANDVAQVTIIDDEAADLIVEDLSIIEGTGGTTTAMVTVKVVGGTVGAAFDFDYHTEDGTALAGSDYTAVAAGTATMPVTGITTIAIDITPDGDVEADETFKVVLDSATSSLVNVSSTPGTVTIENDDDAILAMSGVTVTEDVDPTATVTLTRTGSTAVAFDVLLDSVDGSALADVVPGDGDFTGFTGTKVEFGIGETVKTVVIPITGNMIVEGSETFDVEITDVFKPGTSTPETGVTVTNATTTVGILDDDAATVSISADPSETEGDPPVWPAVNKTRTVTFTLSKEAQEDVTISYDTVDLGGIGDAVGGSDYTTVSGGSVTIKAGSLTATKEIEIIGDLVVEDDEEFNVEATAITAAVGDVKVAPATPGPDDNITTLTIVDDDTASLEVIDVSITEGTDVTGTGASRTFGTTLVTVEVELTGDVQDDFDVELSADLLACSQLIWMARW